MQYNNLMLQRLNKLNNYLTEYDIVKIDAFVDMLIENLHLINDYILIRIPTFDITDKNKIKRYVTDEIGLEACQNEINLNIEMSMNLISVDFALVFLKTLIVNLNINIIMSFAQFFQWMMNNVGYLDSIALEKMV